MMGGIDLAPRGFELRQLRIACGKAGGAHARVLGQINSPAMRRP